MPMDVAMRFCISHSPPPLCGFLGPYEELRRAKRRVRHQQQQQLFKPLRSCISSQQQQQQLKVEKKKKVVFADSRGQSLTAVHVFSTFDHADFFGGIRSAMEEDVEEEQLQFDLVDLQLKAGAAQRHRLALDFTPPAADYLELRRRLLQDQVVLENCSLQERSLSGTVRVRNLGFHKSVQLRVTFDSWTSYSDLPCTFLNNLYGGQDSDTFAFQLQLPAAVGGGTLPPLSQQAQQQRVEFCVCFRVAGQTYWDNNGGRNYALKQLESWGEAEGKTEEGSGEGVGPEQQRQQRWQLEVEGGAELDRFGSPRTSSGLFPGWQSLGHIDGVVPYW